MKINIKKIGKYFKDLNLTKKIIISYSMLFIIFFISLTLYYQQVSNAYTLNKVMQLSIEIVDSIGSNLDLILDTINNNSKILISNRLIQDALSSKNMTFNEQNRVSNYLAEFINFDSMISSIYIFDLKGNKYYIENSSPKDISINSIKKQKHFNKLVSLKGGYLIEASNESISESKSENYISFIRIINGLESQRPVGYLIINISLDYINGAIYNDNNKYNTKFFVSDDSGYVFIRPENKEFTNILENDTDKSNIININKKDYIISNSYNSYGWKITSITPFNELKEQSQTYNIAIIFAILISGFLLVFGMFFASLMITRPIQKLALTMSDVEKGEFKEADFETNNDEIGKLKDAYNMLIRKIQKLFSDIIEDNNSKRKKELEVLQSQIKPHFLYNSFDAISSLALSGKNQEVYKLVKALSKFYKGFLNYGSEIVTVKHELDTVEQYLTIQKIRFDKKIVINKNYDEKTLSYMIPRLILQPLVENAINHGIRPLPNNGIITLQTLYTKDSIQLKVSDNGVGMDKDKVKAIKDGKIHGMGLNTTIERLRIYYSNQDVFNIESKKGHGTIITINIPLNQEIEDNG